MPPEARGLYLSDTVPQFPSLSVPRSLLLLPSAPIPSDATIRHVTEMVFRGSLFLRESIAQRIGGWVWGVIVRLWQALFTPLFSILHRFPVLYWSVIGLLIGMALALIGRATYLWYHSVRYGADGPAWDATPIRAGEDPWLAAQRLAAHGNFTDAAHALYAALLNAVARQQQVRLHPSKTVGDYVRELRARPAAVFGAFRDFARSYETVIYGIGRCDEARYHRLYAIAASIIQPASHG